MTNSTTLRQLEYLQAIHDHWEIAGYAPSTRWLCGLLGKVHKPLSTNAVHDVLAILEREGWVKRTAKVARSVRLTPRGLSFLEGAPGNANTTHGEVASSATSTVREHPCSGESASNVVLPKRRTCAVPQPSAHRTGRGQ